jgi:hypothetical protein
MQLSSLQVGLGQLGDPLATDMDPSYTHPAQWVMSIFLWTLLNSLLLTMVDPPGTGY